MHIQHWRLEKYKGSMGKAPPHALHLSAPLWGQPVSCVPIQEILSSAKQMHMCISLFLDKTAERDAHYLHFTIFPTLRGDCALSLRRGCPPASVHQRLAQRTGNQQGGGCKDGLPSDECGAVPEHLNGMCSGTPTDTKSSGSSNSLYKTAWIFSIISR
jgi:hypothetical protein